MSAFLNPAVAFGPTSVLPEGGAFVYALWLAGLGLCAWALRLISRG
jgi:hypothetical protein